jgi:hypothetical protein
MRLSWISIILLILVTGCAQSERDKYLAEKCQSSLSLAGYASGELDRCWAVEGAKKQCKDYGFTEGTADFSKCLMTIDSERKVRQQISNEAERTRSLIQYKQFGN